MKPSAPAGGTEDDRAIIHHYVFVMVSEALVLLGLYWLAAHYR